MMAAMKGILLLTLLAGSLAFPQPEIDQSFFFDQVDPSARIVGGDVASTGSHPHMVAMSTGVLIRSFLCGGSLITPRTVLTAAHCIDAVFSWGSLTSSLRVTVGTNRWNSGGTSYTLSRNITHPNYLSSTIKNDIGLLITSANVVLGPLVNVIPINYDLVGAGVPVRAAGWGRTAGGGALAPNLMEVNLSTVDGQQCVAAVAQASIDLNVRAPPVEPHIELCTFHSVGRGTCNGDSGSALIRTDWNHQVGVVSWGFPCARGAPDMFARVSAFQEWLIENIHHSTAKTKWRIRPLHAVGGAEAPANYAPHMVALIIGDELKLLICGGSLIRTDLVMTAAHCIEPFIVWGQLLDTYRTVVGTNDWFQGGGITTSIKKVHIHPKYNASTVKYDVGMLGLKSRVTLSDSVGNISLGKGWVGADESSYVTGWGRLQAWGLVPFKLQLLYVKTISPRQCIEGVHNASFLHGPAPDVHPHIEICTFHSVNHGMCNGDSGSALVSTKNQQQIGIVSWGFACALGAPDVFVRITIWILLIIF